MSRPSLDSWREAFLELDDCPWPGPRPLEETDQHLLCGRDDDIKKFLGQVSSAKVIFLTGGSGVGKTSLLRNGLVPELKSRGDIVAVCRDWSGAAEKTNVVSFLEDRVRVALRGSIQGLADDVPVMPLLARDYGERAVLVFDQFEELIRDARGFSKKLFRAIASMVTVSNIKVVISLRMEELYELRQLEHLLPPFTLTTVVLEEIEDGFVPQVVEAGNIKARENEKWEREAIDPDAAALVETWWKRAKRTEDLSKELPPGLLALQGLLYVLDARSGDQPVSAVDVSDLLKALDIPEDSPSADDAARLFDIALSTAAEVKLDRCRSACESVELDPYLIHGTTAVLARAVPHLASAGYKLVRNMWELANLALDRELATLRRGARSSHSFHEVEDGELSDVQQRALLAVMVASVAAGQDEARIVSDEPDDIDCLWSTRVDIARAADELNRSLGGGSEATLWCNRLHEQDLPFDADPDNVSSGPLFGRSPAIVIIEEVRRFALAMEWLRTASLVRFNLPMTDVITVALIHDGFGVALNRWADQQKAEPAGPLNALTAVVEAFEWRCDNGGYRPELDGTTADNNAQLIVNLVWKGCSFFGTSFRQVQFVNCDFRGALFTHCTFEGTSFVNCLLDGLMFSDCRIIGEASAPPTGLTEGARRFIIDSSYEAAATMANYAEGPADGLIISGLPGFPALPGMDDGKIDRLKVESGSLVITGGRTASLSVRNAWFGPSASLCLRSSAGSGFDVIEHNSTANYEFSDCVLRHVTFTTPPHVAAEAGELTIEVLGSALYQVWIGDDLQGTFTAKDSTLLDIWNGSKRLRAKASDLTRFHNLVGVTPTSDCVPLISDEKPFTVAQLEERADDRLITKSHLMDYRRSISDEFSEHHGEAAP